MIPELGQFTLIIALALCLIQAFALVLSIKYQTITINKVIRTTALGQSFFVILGCLILILCFLLNDFSVIYVATNSNSLLPTYYKITALWAAHEGSLLLWVAILSLWIVLVTFISKRWPLDFSSKVLATMGLILGGFLILLIFYSNPFLRHIDKIPLDGADLNPMLQDIGMVSHPPILYMGYVGTTVAFAFAIAALIQGAVSTDWVRLLRPWALLSWSFLTLGITIGSWWAYYELGWGGWWFWDPVENASFMPWLTATALIHCLAVCGKNGKLILLAIFLAITTFALSLLGTFIVRSGIITSVHSFASDPQRGIFILQFLSFIVGGALILYGSRAASLIVNIARNPLNKKQVLILANNILLLVATGSILLGTLYPVFYELLFQQKISVGYPYFNAIFLPIMAILCSLFIILFFDKYTAIGVLMPSILLPFVLLQLWYGKIYLGAALGLFFAIAIILYSLLNLMQGSKLKIAMNLAHIGLAISIIGICITPNYEIEKDVHLKLGENINIADYNISFEKIFTKDGVNYISNIAEFVVKNPNGVSVKLYPEKRLYLAQELAMTETAILPGILQDIYIALGQQLGTDTWSIRIYYKPFVRWIWIGALVMVIGALYGFIRQAKKSV
jgi:cytochrome c-type biogenesis protein CcmF